MKTRAPPKHAQPPSIGGGGTHAPASFHGSARRKTRRERVEPSEGTSTASTNCSAHESEEMATAFWEKSSSSTYIWEGADPCT